MDLSRLLQIPLFRSVREHELSAIFDELKIRETQFKKGDILAMQDESVNRLIILLSGSVKAEMNDPSGKIVKVEDIVAPSPLAILFLFGQDNRFPVQASAREDSTAIIIPKQSVLRMLSMNQDILKNYLDISADFAGRLSRKLHLMSFRTIRQKIALYLIELSGKQGGSTVNLDKSRSALAEYFGVARSSLERELTRMHDDGLITSDRSTIRLDNKKALIELIQQ